MDKITFKDGDKETTHEIPSSVKEITFTHLDRLETVKDDTDPLEILTKVYMIPESDVMGTSAESLDNWLGYHMEVLNQLPELFDTIKEASKEIYELKYNNSMYTVCNKDLLDATYGTWKNFEAVISAFSENDFTKLIRYTVAVFMVTEDADYNTLDFDGKAATFNDLSYYEACEIFAFFLTNSKRYTKATSHFGMAQSMKQFTQGLEVMSTTTSGESIANFTNSAKG